MTNLNFISKAMFCSVFIIVVSHAQVMDTDQGKVEFVGLKKWSTTMLTDSLAICAPKGHGLWGCASELVGNLHFADASVIRYPEGSAFYSVITVVEPQDSARIQYRSKPSGSR